METYKIILIVIIFGLTILDLSLTYYYIHKYKIWQPDKPYNLMENNPLLVFLWNNMNLLIGTIVGAVIILALDYLIIKEAYWIFPLILIIVLSWALFNHYNNITLLNKLIEKYTDGKLPVEVFGNVIGNNK